MRGLWKAALLAPALVSANWMVNDLQDQDVTSTTVDIPVPALSESPDGATMLSFRIDVLASDHICGYGNVTINGQELEQEPLTFASVGKGSINVDGKIVEGSWAFYCLNGFYGPCAQRMDFNVLSVDGKDVEDVTFYVEFKQSHNHKITSTWVLDDPSFEDVLPDPEVSAYEGNIAYDASIDFDNFDIERKIAELKWMSLVQDFTYQIYLKEEALVTYLSEESLEECDCLKCVVMTIYSKARVTAHKVITTVYSKLAGHLDSEGYARSPWKKPHGKKPHQGEPPFPPLPKHGNHSHRNHTCPGKSNHSHPFPPPRPFCHCPPPPPPHGRPTPHHPPHRSPPPYGPSAHGLPSHDPPLPGVDAAPPSDGPPFDGPPFDGPGLLSEFDGPRFGQKLQKVMTAAKLFIVATLLFLLAVVTHRRCCCSAARRQANQARREERHRRRAFRRAAHKHAWRAWFARHIYRSSAPDVLLDDEEKQATLALQPTEGADDAVASEISEFRNAASVVSDMVAAEEGRGRGCGRVSMDSRASLPEYMSELGGESPPTYEDEERVELGGAVADGFRYTPGSSSDYTPSQSDGGSGRDVLGDGKE